ncbi:MAG: type I-E CRISPR-associated protein Cse1/CasA [Chloroflexi bacterium]|nr:type I-E CRISPR-associated protein Cse1/CasA [Chloroflexota bacterium]
MTYSFNLINCPWIPCILPNGKVQEFNLKDTLLQAHMLKEIRGDSPLETASIYRLLLSVLHSALRGPRSYQAWADLRDAGKWDPSVIGEYLNHWKAKFELFDPEKPFYQAADPRVKPKSVITLVMDMVSGNNAVLFDHHTEADGASLPPAKAARTLLTAQTFSLAGLSGLEQKFTDAPWARGIILLTEGESLFETLALNMLRSDDPKIGLAGIIGQPAWEMDDPYLPAREVPTGYLDYLTWQNRRILLIPEGDVDKVVVRQMTMAPGLRLSSAILDPMKHYRIDKDRGYLVLRYSEQRALWRDSAALLRLQSTGNARPPATFYWLAELCTMGYLEQKQLYRLSALGMANNQAKVEFFRHEQLPLSVQYLENSELVEQLDESLKIAEAAGKTLWSSTSWMAVLCISPESDGKNWKEISEITKKEAAGLIEHWAVERFYWGMLELPFLHLLEDLPKRPEATLEWRQAVESTAWQAFNRAEAQAGEAALALKAAVRARSYLAYGLRQVFPTPEMEKIL